MNIKLTLQFLIINFGLIVSYNLYAIDMSFLCIADRSVGFTFNEATNEWDNANFKAGSKYILKSQKNIQKN